MDITPAVRVVSAPWVVTVSSPPIREGAVALDRGGTVLSVGTRGQVRAAHAAAPEERGEGALLPGLVNAHTHLELSALRGRIPGGQGFIPWAGRLQGELPRLDDAERRSAIAAAAQEAADAGTAAVGEVSNTLASVPALAAAGLHGMVFHELVGSREAGGRDAMADAAREFDDACPWPPALGYVPAPHAPYSVGPELFRRIFAAASRARLPTSIHVAEDEDEVRLLRDGSGAWPAVLARMGVAAGVRVPRTSPLAYLQSLGAFETATPPLLVHMVHAGPDDRRIAREAGATAVLCPRSNLHIGGRLADVPALLADGVSLALGTDSLASAPSLSLWAEMATLAERFPHLPAPLWLEAATRGGAEAMRLQGLGVLAPGRRPGIVDVGLDSLEDPTAPIESLVRNPAPRLRWVARA